MSAKETVGFFGGLILLSNAMGLLIYALLRWERF